MKGIYAAITTPAVGNGYSDGTFFSAAGSADSAIIAGVGTIVSLVRIPGTNTLTLDISSTSAPDPALLTSITITNFLGTNPNQSFTFDVSDAVTSTLNSTTTRFVWTVSTPAYQTSDSFTFSSVRAPVGTDFVGLIQFPHLDLGSLGREKQLVGVDIVADAPEGVTISVGYDQRDLTKRTTAYAIDADTLPAQMVPIPVSGPSFDLQINFPAKQIWEWQAANLYVQDWRVTS